MELLGVDYGCVINAPGARGFYGEEYLHQWLWRLLGWEYPDDVTFAAKTMTLLANRGNMLLREGKLTPGEIFPKCIVVKPLSGHVLNAVGLSNPGAAFLLDPPPPLDRICWQTREDPFFLSFAAIAETADKRVKEVEQFVELLGRYLPFPASVALQLDFGCPNVRHKAEGLDEIDRQLNAASVLTDEYDIPIVPNFSVAAPIEMLIEVDEHPACAALWVANVVPWDQLGIGRKRLFGTDISPLARFDGGGLSGPYCFSMAMERLIGLRNAGVQKPIIIGNGIQTAEQAIATLNAGADAIALGIVSLVRPWRMRAIIKAARASAQGGMRWRIR